VGETTPTDPRSRRNQAGRRGGHLLTRALGPSSDTGLPTPLYSQRPRPGRSHRMPTQTRRTSGEGTDGTGGAGLFIPVTKGSRSRHLSFRGPSARPEVMFFSSAADSPFGQTLSVASSIIARAPARSHRPASASRPSIIAAPICASRNRLPPVCGGIAATLSTAALVLAIIQSRS